MIDLIIDYVIVMHVKFFLIHYYSWVEYFHV